MRHGQKVDVNQDIVGLSGANFAAGLSGTFVVNGSPTKTQILDELKGRTQVANITMSAVVLLVVMFLTGLLADMPKAVLGAIVFLIGVDLVDYLGLKRVWRERPAEGVIREADLEVLAQSLSVRPLKSDPDEIATSAIVLGQAEGARAQGRDQFIQRLRNVCGLKL